MGTLSNIKVEPMVVTWGDDVVQVETVTCVADVAGSLNNKYFFLYHTDGTKHHFWYNVNSAGADPAPGGSTAHEIDVATGATASAVATATEAVIEAVSGFDSVPSGAVITVTHSAAGFAPLGHDGNSGFSFALVTEGDSSANIGYVEGEIDVSLSEEETPIKAQETGSNELSAIRTGKKVSIGFTLLETSVAQLSKILRQGGGAFTPIGAGPTQVTGWGTSKDFTQTIDQAKKLSLHPKVLGASDKSRDMTFHLCYAMLKNLKFSGEKVFNVPVEFKVYPKLALNDRVEYFAYGDASQTLT